MQRHCPALRVRIGQPILTVVRLLSSREDSDWGTDVPVIQRRLSP